MTDSTTTRNSIMMRRWELTMKMEMMMGGIIATNNKMMKSKMKMMDREQCMKLKSKNRNDNHL
jgi:hypothetical protein